MERALSLKEIDMNDKRTKWIVFSVLVHLALLIGPSLKKADSLDKLNFAIPKSRVQLQLRKQYKAPVPVMAKKIVKKISKKARKKLVKPIEKKKEVIQNKPVNNVVTDSKVLNNLFKNYVKPKYPRVLQKRKIPGQVTIAFTITKAGAITDLKILSSTHKLLKRSVEKSVSQWVFKELPQQTRVKRKIVFGNKL